MKCRQEEILLEGPAGTGKTRPILELLHLLCLNYPRLRALIVRKTAVSLTTSTLRTFNEKVLSPSDGVRYFGGSKFEPAAYRYQNGSTIVVGGMDNADKVLSTEYDIIYVNEATELTLADWESLTARLRNGILPDSRIVGDCNPAQEKHWLNLRCKAGVTHRILTRHEDNPEYFDDAGTATALGQAYMARLERLTGNRYLRLRKGLWVGVEHGIYQRFDRELHVVDLPPGIRFVTGAIGVDYGSRHKCGVVVVSVDQFGRRWVRDAWGEPDEDEGKTLNRIIAERRQRYGINRGRTDPQQRYMAGQLGFNVADISDGSRQHRVDITNELMAVYPGGRVPKKNDEAMMNLELGPFVEPDTPGLLFVKGAPGIDDLCAEIEGYHYVPKATETREVLVVARIDEDLVAALEDANEELDEEGFVLPPVAGSVSLGEKAAAPALPDPRMFPASPSRTTQAPRAGYPGRRTR